MDLRITTTRARTVNEKRTPAVNERPALKILPFSSPADFMRLKTFNDTTGNTHGMRLSIRPPRKAIRKKYRRFPEGF